MAWYPLVDSGSYYFALDLSGSTNGHISDHYQNALGQTGVPFDADGNGSDLTYDPLLIVHPTFSDCLGESYTVEL